MWAVVMVPLASRLSNTFITWYPKLVRIGIDTSPIGVLYAAVSNGYTIWKAVKYPKSPLFSFAEGSSDPRGPLATVPNSSLPLLGLLNLKARFYALMFFAEEALVKKFTII